MIMLLSCYVDDIILIGNNLVEIDKFGMLGCNLVKTPLYFIVIIKVLSQFMYSLRKSHLNIILRLLRYLKFNPEKGFSMLKSSCFVDADWLYCFLGRYIDLMEK
uniref:Reverse transcriptase Ty1/copia-type domain-containing protein n=1 Tax=Lactuca sativa TaxID=4236 RepID=A0A9R1XEU4_LACSA|nr:hypothetical protein LSAT_V11C400184480 [Lactuca sativa]